MLSSTSIRPLLRGLARSLPCSLRRCAHELAPLRPAPVSGALGTETQVEARELQQRIHSADLGELRKIIQTELENFDEHHAVSSLERLASEGLADEKLLAALLQRLHSGEMEHSTLARFASAAVSLSLRDVVSSVTAQAMENAAEFGNRDMAILSRAMALAGQEAAVAALVNNAAPRAGALGGRALVRLAWAAATVRWQSPALDTVLEEASSRAERLQPQAMSNLLWSMASLRNGNKHALRSLLPHMVHRCRHLSPQGLATGLWALAALRPQGIAVARPGWLEEDAVLRMSTQALRRIEEFSPEDLGALARATAVFASAKTRGGDFSPLAEAVLNEATCSEERLRSLPPRQLQRLLGSMARWRCRDHESLQPLVKEVQRKVSQLNALEAAGIIWASTALQVSAGLVPVLSTHVAGLLEDSKQMDTHSHFAAMAGLLWAASLPAKVGSELGNLQRLDPHFLEITKRMVSCADAPGYQLAGVAVAGARLRLQDDGILKSALIETLSRAESGNLEAQDCALAAHGFATLSLADADFLESLSRSFLQRAGRPVEGWDTARDWSDMVEASLRSGGPQGNTQVELMTAYEDAVVMPLLHQLKAIRTDSD